MIQRLAFGSFLAVFLTLAVPATTSASLIAVDGWAVGDGRLTTDTESGLSWLDLPATTGKSFNDIFVDDFGGLLALGFRAPTIQEVATLLYHAGAPAGSLPGDASSADLAQSAAMAVALFGCTNCIVGATQGIILSDTGGLRNGYAEATGNGIGSFGINISDQLSPAFAPDYRANGVGVFVVMPSASVNGLFEGTDPNPATVVPEPSSLLLLSIGASLSGLRLRLRGPAFSNQS
jgi:hypothetical protein